MEECLFVLCLDDFVTPRVPTKSGYRNSIQLARMDMSYMASMLLHAGGSTLHTANRWFDKFLQVWGFYFMPHQSNDAHHLLRNQL